MDYKNTSLIPKIWKGTAEEWFTYATHCTKCGEPLSLPLPGFEDKTLLDACYCVTCRPEPEKQLLLRLEG